MLTIQEILFGLVMIIITAVAIFLLISIIFDCHKKNEVIQQIEKHTKTFKIERNRATSNYQYE